MTIGILNGLTEELFAPGISPGAVRETKNEYLREATDAAYSTAGLYGNSTPRPPKKAFWDPKLVQSGTVAWYLDPKEIKAMYPREGAELERHLGHDDPIMAFTPEILYKKDKEHSRSVARHEGGHGGQPGKIILKNIIAQTRYGTVPIGEMFIEGSNEWALEQRRMKAPSKFMEEETGKRHPYGVYKDMIYEMEQNYPGVVRQVYRAATRGGPNAVIRLLESTPHIGEIIDKYAAELMSIRPARLPIAA